MPFVYDSLIATLISTVVVLILATIQTEATQTNTARTSRNAVKTQSQGLATWLEEDLAAMGRNLSSGDVAYQDPQDSTQWHTTSFVFSFENSSGEMVDTRYELEKAGTRLVDGEQETLFEVVRSRKVGSGSWTTDGRSPSLGYFKVEMLDADAQPATSSSDVEFTRVRYSVIAPFQNEGTFLHRVTRSVVVPYRLADK